MRHKNGFWTFCFSFIPGAGQMYQGYMKRGLTLVTLFCLAMGLGLLTGGLLAVAMPIVWMYSFFDTFNLRSQLMEGTAPPDDYLVHVEESSLRRLFTVRPKFLGWCLILVGAYSLYELFISPLVWDLYNTFGLYWLAVLLDRLPNLAIALALIGVGLWLIRGKRASHTEEFPYYQEGGDEHGDRQ
ncbi:MAG: hypothetical protein MR579_08180 [Bacteroidales bacterium]|nr:hypothetical protein [Fournierella massiliensis]MCF2557417.1 hypothetical protein [Fournierella massiliensis]MCI6740687.1 hypothetical protein [Bacteroidales bacterium]